MKLRIRYNPLNPVAKTSCLFGFEEIGIDKKVG